MAEAAYFIRCDSSAVIGSGHVMRCINLARALSRKNSEITFISRELPGSVYNRIEKAGFKVSLIPVQEGDKDCSITQQADAESTLRVMSSNRNATLIVDNYALTEEWQSIVRRHARLVVIDDLADHPHDCDILINQNYYPQEAGLYNGLIPEETQLWFGPHYALISDSFSAYRHALPMQDTTQNRAVIFFGAGDPSNLTKIAVLASIKSERFKDIDVLLGPNHPDIDSIEQIFHAHKNVNIHSFIDNFAEFLSGADLMIGAGGVTQLERCCLGIPGIVVAIADNQRIISQNLHDRGCALYLGWHETVTEEHILDSINRFYTNTQSLQVMSTRCQMLVDGHGVGRVSSLLAAPRIVLRPAQIADGEMMHRWRNHPSVREYSDNSESIPLNAHMMWLEKALEDKSRILLIAEVNGIPKGTLRFDFKKENAIVSIYLDPQSIGQGIGYALLETGRQWIQKQRPQTKVLQAAIHEDNPRSLKIFAKAGYRKQGDLYELEI